MKSFLMVTVFLFSASSFAVSGRAYQFPNMKSTWLNDAYQSCLDKLGCKIVGSVGVCRKTSRGPAQSPTSCHLKCNAIDVSAVKCTNTGTDSNRANLTAMAQCLRAIKGQHTMVCYAGKGPCSDAHQDHLHFGANESYKCQMPY